MSHQTRVIKTPSDYEAAMARLMDLMGQVIPTGSDAEAELELLALLIETYERSLVPPVKPDPIEAILFRMDQQGLNRKDLVPYLGSMSKVSEVLARKRPLSLAMIRKLHDGLGIPAEILIQAVPEELDLDSAPDYDYSQFPLQEMYERGCFPHFKAGPKQLKEFAEELMRPLLNAIFPEGASLALLRAPLHQKGSREMDAYGLLAWQSCVLKKVREQKLDTDYVPGVITDAWLRELVKLSRFEAGPKLAQEYLAEQGIVLVIEPHFKKTYLDGAAMLDQGRPIVALTLRHDRLDNFWFALMHELEHVRLHLNAEQGFIVDDLSDTSPPTQEEREADEGAQAALIPPSIWQTAKVRASHSTADAVSLAKQLQIHPAIVAGRVRHENHDWRLLSNLVGKNEVRKHFCLENA